jgi:hypothetical protein
MKRFVGWILVGVGATGTGWGAYYMLTGASTATLHPLPVDAMTGGLVGVALFTIGLIWSRE